MKWWILTLLGPALADSVFDKLDARTQNQVFQIIERYNHLDNDQVHFEEWISPDNNAYIVPRYRAAAADDAPYVYGNGYQFFGSGNDAAGSLATETGPQMGLIKEEDIAAQGFPNLFKKLKDRLHGSCEEEHSAEEYFPFGARKFLLVGVKKESVEFVADENSLQAQEPDSSVDANWWPRKKKEDDCGEEEQKKLFGTDKFFFVGIGSVDNSSAKLRPVSDADSSPLSPLEYASRNKQVSQNAVAASSPEPPAPTTLSLSHRTKPNASGELQQFQNKSRLEVQNDAAAASGRALSLIGALVLIGSSVLLF
ncbi:hypothetical protein KL930_002559 [Ogataea haglerorum]|nr:hypothetical protein KL951_002682 [Ogataea haglerorum]KAG7748906.1 hypothetical protein KL912_001968 [Ogataea haglerorum]KAG7778472.1 hypothetical protein KL930_002559 [Ogataea haglerorum]KAG7779158.1 hypothetical protein KL922_001643 [Ogataea haglerorum]KAG7786964.1 hypothetical protein KL945_003349 [Ogataea haglerorum]